MSRTKNQPELKVGDTIKCRDADDAIRKSEELLKAGIYTEFLYYKDGTPFPTSPPTKPLIIIARSGRDCKGKSNGETV